MTDLFGPLSAFSFLVGAFLELEENSMVLEPCFGRFRVTVARVSFVSNPHASHNFGQFSNTLLEWSPHGQHPLRVPSARNMKC